MMKIKTLVLAFMAVLAGISFTACSSDDDIEVPNMTRYLNEVTSTVNSSKKHDKVILLVAFGSTWQQAYDAFDNTKAEYQSAFPDYDIYLSFSSSICINRAYGAEHVASRSYYAPCYWLEAFGRAQYKEIIVQSLQVIPGEEFDRVIAAMKDFGNNSYGDIDDAYLAELFGDEEEGTEGHVKLGMPLMYDEDDDVAAVAKAINDNYGADAAKGPFLLMGHGNPVSYHQKNYDTYDANKRYTQLETALQTYNKNYFVGTVDMPNNKKDNVWARMKAAGIKDGTLYLTPLMSIAGDHAHNDMAGEGSDYQPKSGTTWDDNENVSWYEYFKNEGYTVSTDPSQTIVKGLLEVKAVRQIWMDHTKNAEVQYLYHSKNPE